MEKRFGSVVLALFLLSFSFVSAAYSQTSANAIINRYISKHAHEEEASEPKDLRKILRGDVNGDHKEDLVALYTLEGGAYQGGNFWTQYIVVFIGKGNSFRYAAHDVVGRREFRDVILKSVVGSRINLDTIAWDNGKKGKAVLVLKNGKLVEL